MVRANFRAEREKINVVADGGWPIFVLHKGEDIYVDRVSRLFVCASFNPSQSKVDYDSI